MRCAKAGLGMAVGALVMLAGAVFAFADSAMPRYDVEGLCQHQASLWGSTDQAVLRHCHDEQQSSYDTIKPQWPGLDAAMRDKCDGLARSQNASGGFGDYWVLLSCLKSESAKAADANANGNFKFHY